MVRVSAQSLNRLMGLAGESLVQARWLQPFSTALLKLKKQQDDVAVLLDHLSHALPTRGADDDTIGLVHQAARGRPIAGRCWPSDYWPSTIMRLTPRISTPGCITK